MKTVSSSDLVQIILLVVLVVLVVVTIFPFLVWLTMLERMPVNISETFSSNPSSLMNRFLCFVILYYEANFQLSVLHPLLKEVFTRFKENRGYPPFRVVFYRNGCSEGRFSDVLRYEVP